MKKVLVLLLTLVIVGSCLACFTACSDDDDFKVGVIHIGDPADGSGYSYTHDLGIQAMQAELGLEDSQIIRKLNVSDTDNAIIKSNIEECIAEGCDIIFATSYGFMSVCQELSTQYPEVIFSHGTGYLSNGTNFNNYFGRIYQARYIAGVIAGLNMTVGGNAGYVAAYTTLLAETSSGINAFALGIQSVNPTATLNVKSLNSWYDPANETAYAQALLAAPYNCEVIAQHCDTANPMIAAANAGKLGVGYNSDMSKTDAGASVITSVTWNWGVYYTAATKAAKNGTWAEFMVTGQNYYASYNDGICGVVKDGLDEKELAYVNAVEALYAAGTWDVFNGNTLTFTYDETAKTAVATPVASALMKNDGTAAGTVDDGVIKGTMNYLVDGVIER